MRGRGNAAKMEKCKKSMFSIVVAVIRVARTGIIGIFWRLGPYQHKWHKMCPKMTQYRFQIIMHSPKMGHYSFKIRQHRP